MRRTCAAVALAILGILAAPSSISAAPSQNASHVAWLATQNGGGDIADQAQSAEKGVSGLAGLKGPWQYVD